MLRPGACQSCRVPVRSPLGGRRPVSHTASLLRKSAPQLGTHLTWANQPQASAAADALPRRAPAGTIPGALALPLPTPGPAHTWMPPGRDGVNEPMGRGGRKAANGSGQGAGDTRLRSNGVPGGGARGPRANETVRLGAPRRWDSRLRRR